VQHHIAHIYSVKAQHNLKGEYLSFIFDGTGYGSDNSLWGGEVFINDKRKYSFKTIKLLGSSKAIKEPKRVALSLLFDKYSLDEVLNLDLPTIKAFSISEIKLLYQAYSKNINSPSTSSVGRLFDAVASISGACQIQSYEGEAGLACEMLYEKSSKDSFEYSLEDNIIDIKFDFFDNQIVSKFINTLVKIIIDISKKENLSVILSGGVFQNKTLLELCLNYLEKENIKHYTNTIIPLNDSGISVGQIWYYLDKKY
jgi:hydrogenase maturation protein HypF